METNANDLELISAKNSANDEDRSSQNTFQPFMQMEELYDKLKLLNHENDFIKPHKLRPLNRWTPSVNFKTAIKYTWNGLIQPKKFYSHQALLRLTNQFGGAVFRVFVTFHLANQEVWIANGISTRIRRSQFNDCFHSERGSWFGSCLIFLMKNRALLFKNDQRPLGSFLKRLRF